MNIGKKIRLSRLFTNSRSLIVPVDDSLINGPEDGLYDIEKTIKIIIGESPNGILCFKGILKNYQDLLVKTPIILNLTGSTTRTNHTREQCSLGSGRKRRLKPVKDRE